MEQVYPSYEKNDSFTSENYREVVEYMRLQIQPIQPKTTKDYTIKFWSCTGKKIQKAHEPVKSFYHRIIRLQNKAGIPDSPKVRDFVSQVFVAGLYSRKVKNSVESKVTSVFPATCPIEDLLEVAGATECYVAEVYKKNNKEETKTINNVGKKVHYKDNKLNQNFKRRDPTPRHRSQSRDRNRSWDSSKTRSSSNNRYKSQSSSKNDRNRRNPYNNNKNTYHHQNRGRNNNRNYNGNFKGNGKFNKLNNQNRGYKNNKYSQNNSQNKFTSQNNSKNYDRNKKNYQNKGNNNYGNSNAGMKRGRGNDRGPRHEKNRRSQESRKRNTEGLDVKHISRENTNPITTKNEDRKKNNGTSEFHGNIMNVTEVDRIIFNRESDNFNASDSDDQSSEQGAGYRTGGNIYMFSVEKIQEYESDSESTRQDENPERLELDLSSDSETEPEELHWSTYQLKEQNMFIREARKCTENWQDDPELNLYSDTESMYDLGDFELSEEFLKKCNDYDKSKKIKKIKMNNKKYPYVYESIGCHTMKSVVGNMAEKIAEIDDIKEIFLEKFNLLGDRPRLLLPEDIVE